MGFFKDELVVTPCEDGRRWILKDGFTYYHGEYRVSVPSGFVTDFASVPRIFWSLIPSWGKYGKAAVVHDFLYQEGYFTRKTCDKIFLYAMTTLGVASWRKYIMYLAVRLFGKPAYKG